MSLSSSIKKQLKIVFTILFSIVGLFFFLVLIASSFPGFTGFDIIFELILGWVKLLDNNLKKIEFDFSLFLTFIVCFSGSIILIQYFVKSVFKKIKWGIKDSFLTCMAVLSLFVIGVASVGIVHHAKWIFTTDKKLIHKDWSLSEDLI